jgi:hypothetical protein
VLLALTALAARGVRGQTAPYTDLAIAGVVSAVLWMPPILEAGRHHGGNLRTLWRFFADDIGGVHPIREAIAYWSYGLVAIVRSDVTLPWGGHLDVSSAPWAPALALALLIALVARLVMAIRARESFDAWLAAVTTAAALASLWGLLHARGDILDHEIFWLTALGTFAAGLVAAAAIGALQREAPTWQSAEPHLRRASAVFVCGVAVVGALQAVDFVGKDERSAFGHDAVPATLAIDEYLDREHSRAALIEIEDEWAQAAPIILRLRQHHRRIAVSPASVFMFTDAFAPTGREDAWMRITRAGQTPRGGGSLIFDSYRVVVIAEPGRFPGSR